MKKRFCVLGSTLFWLMACQQPHTATNNTSTDAAAGQDTSRFRTVKPPENDTMTHEETEFYTPIPPVVKPGRSNSDAPSDAVVLFDGNNLHKWVRTDDTTQQAGWVVEDGHFTVKPGTGNIQTRQKFHDFQLHLEFREPEEPDTKGQNHGNSGLFLASLGKGDDGYELQILNSYNSKTYTNGQAGSVYKQYPPLVNACKPAGEWQTYDVIWMAPQFNADSTLARPATVTAFQNGILIQNHTTLKGVTLYVGHPYYYVHGAAPLKLQDHHHKVSYRNIWLRPLE